MPIDLPTITQKVVVDTSQFAAAIGASQGMSQGMAGHFGNIGADLTKFVSLPIAALGGLAIKAQMDVGGAFTELQRKTGETGKTLDGLKTSFVDIAGKTPEDMKKTADAIAEVHTRTNLIGKPLDDLSLKFIELGRITGQQVDFRQLQLAMSGFGVQAKDMSPVLDELFRATEKTGVPLDQLTRLLQTGGPAFREFGLSIGESAGLMGLLEKAGVPATSTVITLKRAISDAAKAGQSPELFLNNVVTQIQELTLAGDKAAATSLAIKLFGPRGQNLVEALANGSVSLDQFHNTLTQTGDGILTVADKTKTFGDRMKEFKNQAEIAISPIGKIITDNLASAVDFASPKILGLLNSMGDAAAPLIILGGALMSLGPAIQTISAIAQVSPWILVIVAAIAALVVVGIALYNNFAPVRDLFSSIGDTFKSTIGLVKEFFNEAGSGDKSTWKVEQLADKIGGLPGFAIKSLVWFRDVFWPGMQKVWDGIYNTFWKIVDWVVAHWPEIKKVMLEVFGPIVEHYTSMVDSFKKSWPDIQKVMLAIGGVIYVLWQTVVMPFVRWFQDNWHLIAKAWKDVATITEPILDRFGKLMKIALVAAAPFIALMVAGLIALRVAWDAGGQYVLQGFMLMLDAAVKFLSGIIDVLDGVINFVVAIFTGDWAGAWDAIKEIFNGIWEIIQGALETILLPLILIGTAVWDYIGGPVMEVAGVFAAAWDWIVGAVTAAWDFLWPIFQAILDFVGLYFVTEFQIFQAVVEAVWGGVMAVIDFAWNSVILPIWDLIVLYINTVLVPIWSAIWDAVNFVWSGIVGVLQFAWGFISGVFDAIVGGIQWLIGAWWSVVQTVIDVVGNVVGWLAGLPGRVWDVVSGLIGRMLYLGAAAFTAIKDGASSVLGAILDFIRETMDKVWTTAYKIVQAFYNFGKDIIQAIIDGIKSLVGTVVNTAKDVGQKIYDNTIGRFLGSPVTEGPMRTFGQDLMKAIAFGIQDTQSQAINAAADAAKGIQDAVTVSPDVTLATGAVTGAGVGAAPIDTSGIAGGVSVGGAADATGLTDTTGAAGGDSLGGAWAAQLTNAAANLGPNVATALTGLIDDAVPVITDFGTQSTTSVTDTMTGILTTVTDNLTSINQQHTDQYAQMNQTVTANLDVMNAGTAQQWSVMNQNTSANMTLLTGQVSGTMQTVLLTMTTGARDAAQSFVDRLNEKIPPLQFTLAAYGESVKQAGRDFLTQIGAPVTFAQGGTTFEHGDPSTPQIAPDGAWRVFAEKGTGDEAFIPRNVDHKRALDILKVAAGWHGATVLPYDIGGLNLVELFWEAGTGTDWKNGVDIGRTIGGHTDHTHAGTDPGHVWQDVQAYLGSVGIVGRPTSTTRPGDGNSLHAVGRAVDYGDSQNNPQQIYDALVGLAGGVGGAGGLASLPFPTLPGPPDFGLGIPALEASHIADIEYFSMMKKLLDIRAFIQASRSSSAGQAASGAPGALDDWIVAGEAEAGVSDAHWHPGLRGIAMRESSGNPGVVNTTDSNARAGNPSEGLMQLTQSNFRAYGPPGGSPFNPIDDIFAAIRYIQARYGDISNTNTGPTGAYRAGGFYAPKFDNGGVLFPGLNMVFNDTGGIENLIPADQLQSALSSIKLSGRLADIGAWDTAGGAPENWYADALSQFGSGYPGLTAGGTAFPNQLGGGVRAFGNLGDQFLIPIKEVISSAHEFVTVIESRIDDWRSKGAVIDGTHYEPQIQELIDMFAEFVGSRDQAGVAVQNTFSGVVDGEEIARLIVDEINFRERVRGF